jgi:hypothetical protein
MSLKRDNEMMERLYMESVDAVMDAAMDSTPDWRKPETLEKKGQRLGNLDELIQAYFVDESETGDTWFENMVSRSSWGGAYDGDKVRDEDIAKHSKVFLKTLRQVSSLFKSALAQGSESPNGKALIERALSIYKPVGELLNGYELQVYASGLDDLSGNIRMIFGQWNRGDRSVDSWIKQTIEGPYTIDKAPTTR